MPADSPLTVEECAREIAASYDIRDHWTGELRTTAIEELIRRTQPQWIDVREKFVKVLRDELEHWSYGESDTLELFVDNVVDSMRCLPEPPRER